MSVITHWLDKMAQLQRCIPYAFTEHWYGACPGLTTVPPMIRVDFSSSFPCTAIDLAEINCSTLKAFCWNVRMKRKICINARGCWLNLRRESRVSLREIFVQKIVISSWYTKRRICNLRNYWNMCEKLKYLLCNTENSTKTVNFALIFSPRFCFF